MANMGGRGDFSYYTDMKKFVKNLLLRNRCSEYGIISQDCSLGDPFQELLMKFWSVENGHCGGGGGGGGGGGLFLCVDLRNFLKILLLWNRLSDFEIISLDCSLGEPFQKVLTMGGLFALYGHEEILKKIFFSDTPGPILK